METEKSPNSKAKLTEVNSYLTCPLCKGYYIDATTIVECLHSFCRSCIIQHLQQDNYCPICELMVNTAKPNIKPDKTLQDIVYKLVPGLYASEMARRRRFWSERPTEASKVSCPEARGLMTERIIFSPQDAISLSIEYTSDEPAGWQRTTPDPEVPLRRYLQCPAMLRVEHLKKFICNKYNVDISVYHVDILYKRVPLPDHYTLMDIAYIYSWKRNEPMKFFFRITDIALVSERFDYFEPSKQPIRCQQRVAKQHIVNNNNNIDKKSMSPVRQSEKSISDVIPKCDSEISDKKCSENKDRVFSDNKCEKDKDIVNNNQKISDENVDNTNKPVSEVSDIKNLNKDAKINKIECKTNKNLKNNILVTNSDVKSEKKCNKSVTTPEKKLHEPTVPKNTEKVTKPDQNTEKTLSKSPEKPALTESTDDTEKNQFLMSIQLTAKNSSPPTIKNNSPPALKPIFPEFKPKIPQKRKYTKKEKSPNNKKIKLDTENSKKKISVAKIKKLVGKSENDSKTIKNIKNPIVRLMVSNLNKQATNLTKIVGQADASKTENEQLQSLIDSCKINIPSSLSITLTESSRNEDGTIVPSKPQTIKPVQNYIEILKLPDKTETKNDITETPKKSEAKAENGVSSKTPNNQSQNHKHTFQTMFEETIKRDESMKAQLFQIQTQAKSLELAKKAANKINVPKQTIKKPQNNALDLSKTSPKHETNSSSSNSPSPPVIPTANQNKNVPNSKRNILEIAHQLSKRSKLETDPKISSPSPVLSHTPPPPSFVSSPRPSPSHNTSPPSFVSPKEKTEEKIIINSNFSSGGSIQIKKSPKKLPIPRLPIQKIPTPKLTPPSFKNGGLLKFSNYTAKLANSTANSITQNNPKSPMKSPSMPTVKNDCITGKNDSINGLTTNQILEKYNITNLAQFNANLNPALAFQQALMMSHQYELHRMQQNSQKHWMSNQNILAHYENYVQSLKNQQNIIGNSSKN